LLEKKTLKKKKRKIDSTENSLVIKKSILLLDVDAIEVGALPEKTALAFI